MYTQGFLPAVAGGMLAQTQGSRMQKEIGLVLGIVLFVALLLTPFGADPRTHRMAAVAALMAAWWITEAIPLAATSLMPLVLMPFLKISDPDTVARSYMNDYIFLFVGGFTIALAMERWNLHRRLALHTVRRVGDQPRRLVLGFMVATAALSMWISNTATTMMMIPLALSVVSLTSARHGAAALPARPGPFGLALLLSIAYASSIGGIATLIGTPPNVVFASRFHTEFPGAPEIGFANWLIVGLPFSAVFLLITWALLVFFLHPLPRGSLLGGRQVIAHELSKLGPMTSAERRILAVFLSVSFLWIFRAEIPIDLNLGWFSIAKVPGWSNLVGLADAKTRWISDGTVAMMAALSMFFIPAGRQRGERLVDWTTIEDLPWNVLFLFGGGFALADGFVASGLSNFIGLQLQAFGSLPVPGQILGIAGTMTFLTELTSNTATANLAMPLLSALARAIQVNPLVLLLPATISASCAFMLPVATPPNAIVFGTRLVPIRAMIRAGLWLNFIGMILVLLLVYFVAIPLWQIDPRHLPPGWLAPGS